MNNIVEVMVPDEECESMRDITRAVEDACDDVVRAKQRLDTKHSAYSFELR